MNIRYECSRIMFSEHKTWMFRECSRILFREYSRMLVQCSLSCVCSRGWQSNTLGAIICVIIFKAYLNLEISTISYSLFFAYIFHLYSNLSAIKGWLFPKFSVKKKTLILNQKINKKMCSTKSYNHVWMWKGMAFTHIRWWVIKRSVE